LIVALLSIKPEFATRIFDGLKKYEYRRKTFKHPVSRIVVYVTAPVSMVIGEFEVESILCDDIKSLWCQTKHSSGVSEAFFFSYFSDRENGYAIKIGKTTKYSTPISLLENYGLQPPQSFIYLSCPLKTSL